MRILLPLLLLALCLPLLAQTPPPEVADADGYLAVVDGVAMVPLFETAMFLGADVLYSADPGIIKLSRGQVYLTFTLGKDVAQSGGRDVKLAKPAQQLDKTHMLMRGVLVAPARVLADTFGAALTWDGSSGTLTLTRPDVKRTVKLLDLEGTVMRKAAENAKRYTCLNNLRQIGLAIMMYVQDNEETMPDAKNVWKSLAGLDKKTLTCPLYPDHALGYGFNAKLSGKALGDIADPMNTLLAADCDKPLFTALKDLAPRHDGSYQAVFLDGHAELVKPGSDREKTIKLH